jgi:hypothetical protein
MRIKTSSNKERELVTQIAATISLKMFFVNASLIQELVKFNRNPKKMPVAVTRGCLY